jgi:hypothetical protein
VKDIRHFIGLSCNGFEGQFWHCLQLPKQVIIRRDGFLSSKQPFVVTESRKEYIAR